MSTAAADIRNARAEDAERLVQLHYDAVHGGAKNEYPLNVLDSWSPQPDQDRFSWMRKEIDSGRNRILVLETADGAIGGFCIFSSEDGFIYAVYVAPRGFGNGMGHRLLRSAESSIAEAGTSQARLNASKNALGFYKSEGYVEIRPTTQSLSDGSQMDCYEMLKALSA